MSSSTLRYPIIRRRASCEETEDRAPAPAEVDKSSLERLEEMLEASTLSCQQNGLVLLGAGLYDQQGKPRSSQNAARAIAQPKKRRVRKATQKRSDGLTRRGRLADLAELLGQSPALESGNAMAECNETR